MTGANPTSRAWHAALLLAAAAFCGCETTPGVGHVGGWERDVSAQADQWGAYQPQTVYELQRDVFLLDVPGRTNGRALVPGFERGVPPGIYTGPTSVAEYKAAPNSYRNVIGTVDAGTRVRAEALRAKGNVLGKTATEYYVRGRILEGEFRNWQVDLHLVSHYHTDPESGTTQLTGPNEDFLRLD